MAMHGDVQRKYDFLTPFDLSCDAIPISTSRKKSLLKVELAEIYPVGKNHFHRALEFSLTMPAKYMLRYHG